MIMAIFSLPFLLAYLMKLRLQKQTENSFSGVLLKKSRVHFDRLQTPLLKKTCLPLILREAFIYLFFLEALHCAIRMWIILHF